MGINSYSLKNFKKFGVVDINEYFCTFLFARYYKMIIQKTLALSVLTAVLSSFASYAVAQDSNPSNLTSSPYTRYGFGKLGTVGNASTRGMGDVGIALRTNLYTNLYNPASLTAIDTLTMLFDTALDTKMVSRSENGSRESDWNAGFGYFSFHFPLWNRFAGAISYMPYSTVGYEYGIEETIAVDNSILTNDTLSHTDAYTGNGGLQHFQLSMAWNPIKTRKTRLDLGVTAGYICGNIEHTGSMYVSSGQGNSTSTSREFSCIGWDITLGAQYTQLLRPGRLMTVGVTYAPQTHIGCDCDITKTSGTSSIETESRLNLSVPSKLGVGVSYQMDRKLTVAADYAFEQWSDVKGIDNNLKLQDAIYQDVSLFSVGAEYRPKLYAKDYLQTCLYRVGFSARNSYILAFDNKEYSVSCGMGMPVGKRSLLNLAVSYTHVKPNGGSALKENFLGITLGMTFNEMMFYRSKLR